jgi:DNA-binding NarL/FixJ family response regulator
MAKGSSGTTVVIAASDSDLRRRIVEGLRQHSAAGTLDDAKDRHEFERLLVERQPGVVLLGLPLRGFASLDGLETIRTLSPASRTIVLAHASAEIMAVEALKRGARGYCAPTTEPAVLCKAIEFVQHGEIWLGRKLMLQLLDAFTKREPNGDVADADFGLLTLREQEISRLIASGASNKEIADRLLITEKTVKAHLTHTFRKLGLSSRVQLAVYGTRSLRPIATKVQ